MKFTELGKHDSTMWQNMQNGKQHKKEGRKQCSSSPTMQKNRSGMVEHMDNTKQACGEAVCMQVKS